jgi:pyridinium-3,5-bisthiocarboxylic acid mononucleotide nickel chelatase
VTPNNLTGGFLVRLAYLDCMSGISGDMMLGGLVDAGVPMEEIQAGIDSLGLPSCRLVKEQVRRRGFRATQVRVEHQPEHVHRHLHQIVAMIDGSRLSPPQKELAKEIFNRLGQAEAHVHGVPISKVHFHEVGAVDSIADIVGSAIGWDLLGVDQIHCSPVPTGSGSIQIAHGRVSVPAPATAELLKGIPLGSSAVDRELTTPTGAAIVASLVDKFGPLPAMKIQAIGYGAGSMDFEQQANILRLIIGQSSRSATAISSDVVWVLETNLDDVTGESIGYCTNLLMQAGALDVYCTAIQMKKNRPGVKLTALCRADDIEQLERIVFKETATLGIRRWPTSRQVLEREPIHVETQWGTIQGKLAKLEGQPIVFSPEYESCRAAAERHQVPLRDVIQAARQAFDSMRLT